MCFTYNHSRNGPNYYWTEILSAPNTQEDLSLEQFGFYNWPSFMDL